MTESRFGLVSAPKWVAFRFDWRDGWIAVGSSNRYAEALALCTARAGRYGRVLPMGTVPTDVPTDRRAVPIG